MAHLADRGVGTGIHYKFPAHLQPALRSYPQLASSLKVTRRLALSVRGIPYSNMLYGIRDRKPQGGQLPAKSI